MKNLTVIDAINELIKGVNIAYARGGASVYTMLEIREIFNAIEFLNETIKTQTQAQAAATEVPTPVATPIEGPASA